MQTPYGFFIIALGLAQLNATADFSSWRANASNVPRIIKHDFSAIINMPPNTNQDGGNLSWLSKI